MTSKAAQSELDNLLHSGILPKAVYEEMRAAYQVKVAASEQHLRDLYNQRREPSVNRSDGERTKLEAIRRRLLLAEKGVLNDALRKRIISEDLAQPYLKELNEQLLKLEDD